MTASEWLFLKDLAFLVLVGVVVFFVVFGSFEDLVGTTSTIVLAAAAAFGAVKFVGWALLGWS